MWLKGRIPTLTAVQVSSDRPQGFREAFNYDGLFTQRLLAYFRRLSNLFDLEFFMNKLASHAYVTALLESSVSTGLPFWEEADDSFAFDPYLE